MLRAVRVDCASDVVVVTGLRLLTHHAYLALVRVLTLALHLVEGYVEHAQSDLPYLGLEHLATHHRSLSHLTPYIRQMRWDVRTKTNHLVVVLSVDKAPLTHRRYAPSKLPMLVVRATIPKALLPLNVIVQSVNIVDLVKVISVCKDL